MTDERDNSSQPEESAELIEQRDLAEIENKHLGIAGRIACTFIDSPISPLLMIATLAIGLLGLVFTPRQEDPQISVPMIDVFVQYPGASADQVSSLVTEPLARIMSQITGVRHVYSSTQRGQAMVTVRFKVGEELGPSIVKVHDKLQSNMDLIPPGVSMPLVKPKGIDDVPVVTITLSSDSVDDAALRTLGVDVLQRLRQVKNTGQGFVVGGRAEQVRVEVYPERLAGYGITLDQLAQTISAANQESPAGSVEAANSAFSVYTGSFLRTADEIERLVVGTWGGSPIYVRDIAKVFHGPEEAKQMVAYYSGPAFEEEQSAANGDPAVTVALAKKEGSNGVTVANDILAKLDTLRGHLIPDNVRVSITRDYGKTANDKVNELLTALFEAALAVSILCLIGLGFRAAFVVITVIPIVILITVWSAWVLDYTIDRVSLFALIFSIGILVDDATVVVENIFRRWMDAGRTTVGVAIDAVREVGNPTILATLTIISALLPMGFVSGLMGPYMRPIPVLGSSAMFFSLVAAFIFTPWFAVRMRPASVAAFKKAEAREQRTHEIVGKIYEPIIRPLVNNRSLGIIFLISIILTTAAVCSLFYFKVVAVKMLPFDNKPEFNVVVNMPEGTALPVTANVVQQLAETIRREIPEVTALQTYVGTASPFNFNGLVRHYYLRQEPWMGDIQVMLLDKNDRERSSHELSVVARELLTPLAEQLGARIQVVEMPPGPPVLQTVTAEIYGPDEQTLRQTARDMLGMFEEVGDLVDVDTYMAEPYTYWHFEIDREKAIRKGVSVETINRNLTMAMGGHKLGDVKRAAPLEPTYIVVQAPLSVRSQVSRLSNLPIPTSTGGTISLAELGRFVQRQEDPYIYHKDLRPVEYVTGEMTGRLGAPIYGMFSVEDLLENYTAPDGVKITGMPMGLIGPPDNSLQSGFEWAGEWTVTYETFRDMGIAFIAAMLLIYGLIVLEFRDYALAGLIMAPIPLTLIGIIPGHWIMGAEFTATSMIGLIALGGIIVRVSILLVEFVKHEVAAGKEIREAAIAAAKTRLRPILITSLTLMAGAAAIIRDPIFNGMAVTLLFGTGVATLFTLIVIPMGCISAEKRFATHGCDALEQKLSEEDQAEKAMAEGK
ncbi:efflux RND transporter permease subunit [Thiogranum longum]